MKKLKKIIIMLIAGLMLFSASSCGGASRKSGQDDDEDMKIFYDYTKKMSDNGALLTNPGMGWDFGYYANSLTNFGSTLKPDDYLDDFPCDICYFRLGWSDIEPVKGQYNWALIDDVADKWIARGKKIAFRICCVFPGHQDTPLWVKEMGAKGVEYNTNEASRILLGSDFYAGIEDTTWIAYYDDPVFLRELEIFLKAFAEKYDGKDYVEFVDIGSLGSWGEGNEHGSWMGHIDSSSGKKEFVWELDKSPTLQENVETHLRLYRKCLPNTRLLANDDMCNTGKAWFFELLDELNIGVNDDSVQTGTAADVMANTKVLTKVWQKRHVSIEHHPTTIPTNVYYQSLLESHASYARIHMNPYYMKDSAFTDMMTKKLGYRLVFTQLDFTKPAAGQKMHVKYKIKNTGAAPCYAGGFVKAMLVDSEGKVLCSGVSSFDVKELKVECKHDGCLMNAGISKQEAEEAEGTLSFDIPASVSGEVYLAVSIGKDDGTAVYNLPLDKEMSAKGLDKVYEIGKLEVQ